MIQHPAPLRRAQLEFALLIERLEFNPTGQKALADKVGIGNASRGADGWFNQAVNPVPFIKPLWAQEELITVCHFIAMGRSQFKFEEISKGAVGSVNPNSPRKNINRYIIIR